MYSIPNLSNTKPNTKRIEPARTSNLTLTIRRSVTLLTTQNIVSKNPSRKEGTLSNQKKTHHTSPNPSQAYHTLQLAHAVRSQPASRCAAYHVCTASGTAVVSSAVYRVSVAVMVLYRT